MGEDVGEEVGEEVGEVGDRWMSREGVARRSSESEVGKKRRRRWRRSGRSRGEVEE